MAENNPIATIWNHLRHPIQSIRNNLTQGANEWREHPIQEGLQRLIGVGTGLATANPGLGRAANSAADRFFSWLNNRGNNDFGPASGLQGITSPPVPDCTRLLSWDCLVLMDDWALAVMGLIEAETAKGYASRTCEGGLRDKGVIR